jgi:cephalosporin hydroxylase
MKLTIDTTSRTLTVDTAGAPRILDLYTAEAFEALSREWVRLGWQLKYSYGFTWFGRPVIQLPEDLIRLQEALYAVAPDVIVETGVAHGGSLIFHASLCKALGRGRVVGVDIDIRKHNRAAIEQHALAPFITLLEGSSTSPAIVDAVRAQVRHGERVLVILDSNHSRDHVRAELEAYAPLVSPGSYLVAADGIMRDLTDVPGGHRDWRWDNPAVAVADFLQAHPEFELSPPRRGFDESSTPNDVTYWPDGWLRRRPDGAR